MKCNKNRSGHIKYPIEKIPLHTLPLPSHEIPVVCGSDGWFASGFSRLWECLKNSIYASAWELTESPASTNLHQTFQIVQLGKESPAVCICKRHLAEMYLSGKAIQSFSPSVLKFIFSCVFIEYRYFFNTPYLPLEGHMIL